MRRLLFVLSDGPDTYCYSCLSNQCAESGAPHRMIVMSLKATKKEEQNLHIFRVWTSLSPSRKETDCHFILADVSLILIPWQLLCCISHLQTEKKSLGKSFAFLVQFIEAWLLNVSAKCKETGTEIQILECFYQYLASLVPQMFTMGKGGAVCCNKYPAL